MKDDARPVVLTDDFGRVWTLRVPDEAAGEYCWGCNGMLRVDRPLCAECQAHLKKGWRYRHSKAAQKRRDKFAEMF